MCTACGKDENPQNEKAGSRNCAAMSFDNVRSQWLWKESPCSNGMGFICQYYILSSYSQTKWHHNAWKSETDSRLRCAYRYSKRVRFAHYSWWSFCVCFWVSACVGLPIRQNSEGQKIHRNIIKSVMHWARTCCIGAYLEGNIVPCPPPPLFRLCLSVKKKKCC